MAPINDELNRSHAESATLRPARRWLTARLGHAADLLNESHRQVVTVNSTNRK